MGLLKASGLVLVGVLIGMLVMTAFTGALALGAGVGLTETASAITNNSDAQLVQQPDGDVIVLIPEHTEGAGYDRIRVYNNSSGAAVNRSGDTAASTAWVDSGGAIGR
jgi:hypothetical protein